MTISKDRFFVASDGSVAYVTADGDMVDHIAFAYYGRHKGTMEAIYKENVGLAELDMRLDAGLTIRLPALKAPEPTYQRKLWD